MSSTNNLLHQAEERKKCDTAIKRIGIMIDGKGRLGPTVRLIVSILGGAGSSHGNSLSRNGGKAAYILPSPDPALAGASCTGPPFFFFFWYYD